MDYDGTHKYQVVFVDEYDNWWLCGFYDRLEDALPQVNAFLGQYEVEADEDYPEEPSGKLWLGEGSPFGDLTVGPGSFGPVFDRTFAVAEGGVQVRGFVLL